MKKKIGPLDKHSEMIVTKEQVKTINKLNKITSEDSGRSIEGMFTKGNVQIASNGWSILAIKSENPMSDELQGLKVIDTEGRIVLHKDYPGEMSFPNIFPILPIGNPVFEIRVDPRWLIPLLNAVEDGYHGVTLRFFGDKKPFEIIGHQGNEEKGYALLMPMFQDGIVTRPEWLDILKPDSKKENEDEHKTL